MKVRSINLGKKQTVHWRNKDYTTGIFKRPVNEPIYLGDEDVENDAVIDRKYHGGQDKACYIFGENHYAYWQKKYPDLDWNYGMFGENITLSNFDEKEVSIGDIYQLGNAVVQISEIREPCSTFSMRFQSFNLMKEFIDYGHCGAYLRIIENGDVDRNDSMILLEKAENSFSVFDVFKYTFTKENEGIKKRMLASNILTEVTKNSLRKK